MPTKCELLDEAGNVLAHSFDGAPIEADVPTRFRVRSTEYDAQGNAVSQVTSDLQHLNQVHDVPCGTFIIVDH